MKITEKETKQVSESLQKVGLFMRTFLQPTPMGFINANLDQFELRAALIEEEFLEFLEAKCKLEQLDALCDLLYVAAGGFITCGFRMPHFHQSAHIKPFARAVAEARRAFVVQPCCDGLRNNVACLLLTNVRVGFAMFKKFSEAFRAVHDNNMGKMWTQDEVNLIVTAEYTATKRENFGDRCYVVLNAKKKIIKPPGFKKVDLTPYLG